MKRLALRRAAERRRMMARVMEPIEPEAFDDPIAPLPQPWFRKLLGGLRWMVAGVAAHAAVLTTLGALGAILPREEASRPKAAPISVEIREIPAAAEPPPAVENLAPKVAPVTPLRPQAQKSEKTRRPPKEVPPAPDPINRPQEETKPKAPPRRIVGLNIESTVQGSGPGFAVGNTRMGATGALAEKASPQTERPTGPSESSEGFGDRFGLGGSQIEKPRRKRVTEPEYPEIYRARNLEGDVVVRLKVSQVGQVTGVELIGPSRYDAFNEAALVAAKRETFYPARRDGVPIEFTISFTYKFRLDG
jgi:periplasmic protein TonB